MNPLAQVALDFAIGEIGSGEDPRLGNNQGLDVLRYHAAVSMKSEGSWCAAFVSYCYKRAAAELQVTLPFELSAGAKKLARNIGLAGRTLKVPEAGAVICWNRGIGWTGHVGIIESVAHTGRGTSIVTVEGNRGPFPSRVERYHYREGSWQKRLYLLARL